jgi:hypothetical protein
MDYRYVRQAGSSRQAVRKEGGKTAPTDQCDAGSKDRRERRQVETVFDQTIVRQDTPIHWTGLDWTGLDCY